MTSASEQAPLVTIRDLRAQLGRGTGAPRLLRDISLSIAPGEILGLVGESGSGKSLTALSILRLLPDTIRTTGGQIEFGGQDILTLNKAEMQKLRGKRIAMIFQDPIRHLNPVFTVGQQLEAAIRAHAPKEMTRAAVRQRAVDLLDQVRIVDPAERLDSYPHQFSGGMAQRVMIALALAGSPDLLLADEPTSALDVTVQAEILMLLRDIARQRGMAVLFISHNLGAVWQLCDRICVMYAGQIVETAETDQAVRAPMHPYTRALVGALPRMAHERIRLANIRGTMPAANDYPPGCTFCTRCDIARPVCSEDAPALRSVAPDRQSRCHFAEDITPAREGAA